MSSMSCFFASSVRPAARLMVTSGMASSFQNVVMPGFMPGIHGFL
jgi:hypothetical protein